MFGAVRRALELPSRVGEDAERAATLEGSHDLEVSERLAIVQAGLIAGLTGPALDEIRLGRQEGGHVAQMVLGIFLAPGAKEVGGAQIAAERGELGRGRTVRGSVRPSLTEARPI